MPERSDALLRQQMAYYSARASEYDQWFYRKGRYDRGPEQARLWFAEADQVAAALGAFGPGGNVLELACGTGIWTERLLRRAEHVTAVDAAPEMLALNEARVGSERATHVLADIFAYEPDHKYDVVFFSFWLSHVPPERFEQFWGLVRRALAPRGRFFVVDSLYDETSIANDHRLNGPEATIATRRLNDGREFEIVKVHYRPDELQCNLEALGWRATVRGTGHYFLYGWGEVAR